MSTSKMSNEKNEVIPVSRPVFDGLRSRVA